MSVGNERRCRGAGGLRALLLLCCLLGAQACSVNPVTGERELSLVSEEREIAIGAQQYLPLRQSQGGDYLASPRVQDYVSRVGQGLAEVSDRDLPYEFRVLNNSVPNAWALPGGKIAINRGLLVALESEAQLAAVLGHELVHAAARHGAQSLQRGLLLQGAVLGTTLATQGESWARLAVMGAGVGSQLVSARYSRDAEREADRYGIRYMVRAGYDPEGAVRLQETFVELSRQQESSWLQGLFASHPPSPERVENNRRLAAQLGSEGRRGEAAYQAAMAELRQAQPAYEKYDQALQALEKGEVEKARELVDAALALEPREGHFHALKGDIAARDADYTRALSHYDAAMARNPQFFYYPLRRGLVNSRLERSQAARHDLKASTELLPTATAFNALGDLARKEGDTAQAITHYRRAAEQKGEVGRQALAALVELDLPDNPERYLQLRQGIGPQGRWRLEIANPTPRAVSHLELALEFPGDQGLRQRRRLVLEEAIPAGEKRSLVLDLVPANASLEGYASGLVGARVAAP